MVRKFAALMLLMAGSAAGAASPSTDFGVRAVGAGPKVVIPLVQEMARYTPLGGSSGASLSGVARIGSQWGRVTSLRRTPAHNRRVGGVANSYHLSGRAIDIARRPGVRHADIAAAYRNAGYHLVESLDEGDHSHFAFGFGGSPRAAAPSTATAEATPWRMVYAPSAGGR